MKSYRHVTGLVSSLILLLSVTIYAQPNIVTNGSIQTINPTFQVQDFLVPPSDPNIRAIEFTLRGGGGGTARFDGFGGSCTALGSNGAFIRARINIGNGPNDIRPNSMLRFIVGAVGSNERRSGISGSAGGGGGGGSAILVRLANSGAWTTRLAAGGGGGGAVRHQARIFSSPDCTPSNGSGGNAGSGDGSGGPGRTNAAGGGGGAFGNGGGFACPSNNSVLINNGERGFPNGGSGGNNKGCASFDVAAGGWGFGGGGAGATGGGGGGGCWGGGGRAAAVLGGGGGAPFFRWGWNTPRWPRV